MRSIENLSFLQAFIATKKNHILRYKFADESIEQLGTIDRPSPLKGLAYLGEDRFVS